MDLSEPVTKLFALGGGLPQPSRFLSHAGWLSGTSYHRRELLRQAPSCWEDSQDLHTSILVPHERGAHLLRHAPKGTLKAKTDTIKTSLQGLFQESEVL